PPNKTRPQAEISQVPPPLDRRKENYNQNLFYLALT
ncbi:hypothetical protein LINPERHAP2_LOCUS45577, partial [Linum perenne]